MTDRPTQVFWSLPGESTFYTLVQTSDSEPVDRFVFAPFDTNQKKIVLTGRAKKIDLANTTLLRPTVVCTSPSTEETDYLDELRKTLKIITEGHLDKVVVSTVTQIQFTVPPVEILKRLRIAHPDTLVYAFNHAASGLWIGATPEPLVRSVQGGQGYSTVSLAGTRQAELQIVPWGQKESLEQSVVTDYIRTQLNAAGASEIRITRPETIRYGQLEHLRSTITFQARSIDAVVAQLHPTPAVAGTPLESALKHITGTEKHTREFYTGYLGWQQGEQQVDLFVNLRCMQIFSDCALVYTGGGITLESDPNDEWRETRNKLNALVNTFAD